MRTDTLDSAYVLWDWIEVSEVLKISKSSIYNLIRKGILPKPLKVGNKSFWKQSDVLAFIDRQSEC